MGVLRHIKLLGENLHNDEDKRSVTVLTDDEKKPLYSMAKLSKIHLLTTQDCHFEDCPCKSAVENEEGIGNVRFIARTFFL